MQAIHTDEHDEHDHARHLRRAFKFLGSQFAGYHLSVADSDMTPCVDPDQLP
jgi:hypothetical protein